MFELTLNIAKEILPDNSKTFGSPNYFLKQTNTHTHNIYVFKPFKNARACAHARNKKLHVLFYHQNHRQQKNTGFSVLRTAPKAKNTRFFPSESLGEKKHTFFTSQTLMKQKNTCFFTPQEPCKNKIHVFFTRQTPREAKNTRFFSPRLPDGKKHTFFTSKIS
jgi:hypothetical protein